MHACQISPWYAFDLPPRDLSHMSILYYHILIMHRIFFNDDLPENMTLLQSKPGLTTETMKNQMKVGFAWEATNWNDAWDELAKLAKPTLVITGTDDDKYQPYVNSLKIVEKIPGAWLVQIKDAGHAVMDQYPDEISKILNTFLSTTTPSS